MPMVKSNGRPSATPLETAQRRASKTLADFWAIEREFKDLLCLSGYPEDSERAKEVMTIANDRLAVADLIAKVLDRKKELGATLRQAEKDGNKRVINEISCQGGQMDELKTQEKELYDRLWSLPQLGATQKEWDEDFDEEMKARPLGRPGLTIDVLYVRALKEAKQAEAALRAEEAKAGITTPFDVAQAAKSKIEPPADAKIPGKPKLDELGKLDRAITDIDKKMRRVERGEDVTGLESYSQKGVLLGRKRRSNEEKLADLQAQRDKIVALIAKEEAKLSESAKIKRKIKLLRDDARRDKVSAGAATSKKEAAKYLAAYEQKRAEAAALESEVKALEDAEQSSVKAIQAKEAPKAKVVVAKVASKKVSEKKSVPTAEASVPPTPVVPVSEVVLTEAYLKELEESEAMLLRHVELLERQAALVERANKAKAVIAAAQRPN